MTPSDCRHAVKLSTEFELTTPLMIRSGMDGMYTDSTIERAADGRLHVNGCVWASLVRRALARVDGAEEAADDIGGYEAKTRGVSPLWCEASFTELLDGPVSPDVCPAEVRHGNRIDRKLGAAADSALYSDEAIQPGYRVRMDANYFCGDADKAEAFSKTFLDALWVISQGVETIGGGWSYGYGRLTPVRVRRKRLDLANADDRALLWRWADVSWDSDTNWTELDTSPPAISRPWTRIAVEAGVLDGQLMAVSTALPPFDFMVKNSEDMPDSFVFRRGRIQEEGETVSEIVIPGKAIRQALLSMPLERRFRSLPGEGACPDENRKTGCGCIRCRWFGSVERRGIVSVADAVVRDAKTEVLNRVQLCEHSFQNMNLFAGEFLSGGRFHFDILVDRTDAPAAEGAVAAIRSLLSEMMDSGAAPPGWHRLGGKSTCAGQVAVHGEPEVFSYGNNGAGKKGA
jgi:hypothetical protein